VSASPDAVRLRRAGDLRAVSLVLARAFRDDPVHRWILPGEFDWALASDAFFAMVMRDMLRHESVFTTERLLRRGALDPALSQPATLRERLAMAARWYAALGRRAARWACSSRASSARIRPSRTGISRCSAPIRATRAAAWVGAARADPRAL
jgi:hypothetical protein